MSPAGSYSWYLGLWQSYLRSCEKFRRWGLLGWKGFLGDRPPGLWLGPLLVPGHVTSSWHHRWSSGRPVWRLPLKHEPNKALFLCVAPSRHLVILRRKRTQTASFLFKMGVDWTLTLFLFPLRDKWSEGNYNYNGVLSTLIDHIPHKSHCLSVYLFLGSPDARVWSWNLLPKAQEGLTPTRCY